MSIVEAIGNAVDKFEETGRIPRKVTVGISGGREIAEQVGLALFPALVWSLRVAIDWAVDEPNVPVYTSTYVFGIPLTIDGRTPRDAVFVA